MRIEDFRNVKNQKPFRPYLIRMADGREIEVRHPDAISWGSEGGRIVSYISPADEWVLIDIDLVTTLAAPAPASLIPDKGT